MRSLMRHPIRRPIPTGHSGLPVAVAIAVAALCVCGGARAAPTVASGTPENVAYADVLRLPLAATPRRVDYGTEPLQYGELWLPTAPQAGAARSGAPQANAPLVVMVHGGCWLNAFSVDHTRPMAAALAQAGFAVWSLEYRRSGDAGGGWPGTLQDIRRALDALPRLGGQPPAGQPSPLHGVDLARVAVVGHSAGGHLALLAARGRAEVRLVVGLAAIVDPATYGQGDNSCQRAVPQFMGGSAAQFPERYRLADAAAVPSRTPTVLLHGAVDAIVPVSQARLAGATVGIIPGAGHFDWLHPDTPAFARLRELLRDGLRPRPSPVRR
ncbi:MAG: alpha/beta hydrolase [Gammaproteobacteria bacterium]